MTAPRQRRVVLELLARFNSPNRRSAQGLVSIPFSVSTISMRFSQLSSQLTRRPRRKTPCLYPPLMDHEPQGSQPRTKYPIIIRKGMLQNIVDGELRRIEETFLRDPGLIPRQVFGVHDRISEHEMFLVKRVFCHLR